MWKRGRSTAHPAPPEIGRPVSSLEDQVYPEVFRMHILHVSNICLPHLTHCCRLGLFYRPVFSFFAQKATEPPVAIFGGERLYFAKEGQPSRITAPTGEENARIPANFQRNRAALRGRPARVHDFLRRHRRDHGLASGRRGAGRRSHHQEAAPIRNLAASPGMHRLHGVACCAPSTPRSKS